jgi:hypothetical protein
MPLVEPVTSAVFLCNVMIVVLGVGD